MKGILVTGGSGFIGTHLCDELRTRGNLVFNYDLSDGFNILDVKTLEKVFDHCRPEEVYHLAGSVHMGPAEENPVKDYVANIQGTLNIIEQCEKHGSRLLFTGTGASYGIGAYPQGELVFPKPVSNYGISKLAAELYVRKWAWSHGLHSVATRYSSVYGLGRKTGPVNTFINQARDQGYMTVHGPGHHTRDLVHVGDAVNGTITVMEKGCPGELYNVSSGKEYSIVEVAWIIHEVTGAEIRHVPFKFTRFDVPKSRFDIKRASRLGYIPKISLREGIVELWNLENS